jgi:hypothetical protein
MAQEDEEAVAEMSEDEADEEEDEEDPRDRRMNYGVHHQHSDGYIKHFRYFTRCLKFVLNIKKKYITLNLLYYAHLVAITPILLRNGG